MNWIDIALSIGAGAGTVLLALAKYYHGKISRLEERMTKLITSVHVHELLKDHLELSKEKIEDKYEPIRERLDRLEDKIDALIARKE